MVASHLLNRVSGICFMLAGGAMAASTLARQDPAPAPATKVLSSEERGDIYGVRKMYREAIEAYTQGTPLTPLILNKIGIAYQQQNDVASARKYYDRAIKLQPAYAEAINNIGTLEYASKNFRRATKFYKRALAIQPGSASVYSNLGTAWFARHNYKEATRCYEEALALDPDVFERHGSHGVMLEQRDVQERSKFNYYMARVYARRGMNDLALQYIRKALEGGFKDKRKFLDEEDFAALRKLPDFDDLMKLEPRVL
jgi:tetratricopeptide (TPR) repeat protein